MTFLKPLATAVAVACALPALAQGSISVSDAYALGSPAARSGAAFMVIANGGSADDRLVGARSDAAAAVEIHTHLMDANGVARMVRVEDGIGIPAGGSHALQRGGDHVMFMGLTQPFQPGATVHVTLVFEQAGEVQVDIPVVDPAQAPAGGMGQGMMQGHHHGG